MNDKKNDGVKEFWVVYSYGSGGLWGVIKARSENEILKKYPEFKVFSKKPGWMSDEEATQIRKQNLYNIDDRPWGLLKIYEEKIRSKT